jgi:hypothetical protein
VDDGRLDRGERGGEGLERELLRRRLKLVAREEGAGCVDGWPGGWLVDRLIGWLSFLELRVPFSTDRARKELHSPKYQTVSSSSYSFAIPARRARTCSATGEPRRSAAACSGGQRIGETCEFHFGSFRQVMGWFPGRLLLRLAGQGRSCTHRALRAARALAVELANVRRPEGLGAALLLVHQM